MITKTLCRSYYVLLTNQSWCNFQDMKLGYYAKGDGSEDD